MTTSSEFGLRSRRVVALDGVRETVVHVRDGSIVGLLEPSDAPPSLPTEDLGDLTLMAGLVDTHVHINDPGRTEWEGFATAIGPADAEFKNKVSPWFDRPLRGRVARTWLAGETIWRDGAAVGRPRGAAILEGR